MTDILRLRTADDAVHYTARDSEAAQRLLRDGAVDIDATPTTEATDATTPSTPGDDQDTGTTDTGPGERERTTGSSRRRDRGSGAD